MAIALKVPSLGESVTQATVGAWLKKEGEPVQADEPLVEVESEKATVARPAPAAGVLRRVLRNTGDTVAIGETIGELDEATAQAQAASPLGSGPMPGGVLAVAKGNGAPRSAPPPPPTSTPSPSSAPSPGTANPPATRAPPSARRLMAEHGVAVAEVHGSGPGGQVRKEDVLRALDRGEPAPVPPTEVRAPAPRGDGAGARERVVPMTVLRRTVARRLVEAQHTAAILTTFNEVDMSRVLALREFPAVNAEVRGTDLVYKDHYDVGVAVGGGKGLVVPVVRDADALSFAEIEKAVADLARRARENRDRKST